MFILHLKYEVICQSRCTQTFLYWCFQNLFRVSFKNKLRITQFISKFNWNKSNQSWKFCNLFYIFRSLIKRATGDQFSGDSQLGLRDFLRQHNQREDAMSRACRRGRKRLVHGESRLVKILRGSRGYTGSSKIKTTSILSEFWCETLGFVKFWHEKSSFMLLLMNK